MQNWVHRISSACIMNSHNLNQSSFMKTGRIFPHFFLHIFRLVCYYYLTTYTILLTKKKSGYNTWSALFLPFTPFVSCSNKMSLALQLWLTPNVPHPAEQLRLFDESGPVCFHAAPGVWCMTALPSSKCSFIPHQGEKKQQKTGGKEDSIVSASFSQSTSKREKKVQRRVAFFFAEGRKWFEAAIKHQSDACRKVNKRGMCVVSWCSG